MNILPYPQDNRRRSGKARNFIKEAYQKGEVIEINEFSDALAIFLSSTRGDIQIYLTLMTKTDLIKIEGTKVIII